MEIENQGGHGAPPDPRAQREDGRGDETVPRLDKRTYLDHRQGRFKVILRDFGDRLCEIGWSFSGATVTSKAGRGESLDREVHEMRAVRRARSRLRHLILASNADHLLTLTYRANVTNFRQASADLGRFIRRVKGELPGWVYVAVPEQQQRGAWHWHLAVIGRQNVDLLRACWRGVIGDGNIDVQKPKSRRLHRRLALVRYLGKYLAKGFEKGNRELNGHRFRASLGIKIPAESINIPRECRGDSGGYVLGQLHKRAGAVEFVWTDPNGMAGWACSWK